MTVADTRPETCLTCLTPSTTGTPSKQGTPRDQVQITYVSHLIEDGVDALFVQSQVGHSWASTTATHTTVGAVAKDRMQQSALARVLAGAVPPAGGSR